eukprot:1023769-Pyramimonas_sp.AAC.1
MCIRDRVSQRSLSRGRVPRVALQLDASYIYHYNVHDHDLTIAQRNGASKVLAADLKAAHHDPLRHAVILHGGPNVAPRAPLLLLLLLLHQPRRRFAQGKETTRQSCSLDNGAQDHGGDLL